MFSDPIILSTSFGLGYATIILILPKGLIINHLIIIFLFSIPKHMKSTSLFYNISKDFYALQIKLKTMNEFNYYNDTNHRIKKKKN